MYAIKLLYYNFAITLMYATVNYEKKKMIDSCVNPNYKFTITYVMKFWCRCGMVCNNKRTRTDK